MTCSPVCAHGHTSSCPEDFLCQMRLGGARYGEWETHSVFACDANVASWRSQVGPVLRRRNYETRVIRLREAIAEEATPSHADTGLGVAS